MKQLGADPRLTTIISAESILNDGIAIVLFTLFYGLAFENAAFSWSMAAKHTMVNTVGAASLGGCFLVAALIALAFCRKEAPVVLTAVITIPFICFYTAVSFGTSGVVALIPLSLGLRLFSRNFLNGSLINA